MAKQKKPKIAIIGFTTCTGCQVVIVDLGQKFLDLFDVVDVGNFPLVEDDRDVKEYDIAIVEGSIVTKHNIKELKAIRSKSKFVIALGSCAVVGGIPEIKNYEDKDKVIKRVYKSIKKIDNPEIKPFREYIDVDYEIPGCPPNANEIFWLIKELLAGRVPKKFDKPVCHECQLREYECMLQKGKPCLGPITLGGCEAICLKNHLPCMACRGPLKSCAFANYFKILKKHKIDMNEFLEIIERFGVKDEVLEEIHSTKKHKDKKI